MYLSLPHAIGTSVISCSTVVGWRSPTSSPDSFFHPLERDGGHGRWQPHHGMLHDRLLVWRALQLPRQTNQNGIWEKGKIHNQKKTMKSRIIKGSYNDMAISYKFNTYETIPDSYSKIKKLFTLALQKLMKSNKSHPFLDMPTILKLR